MPLKYLLLYVRYVLILNICCLICRGSLPEGPALSGEQHGEQSTRPRAFSRVRVRNRVALSGCSVRVRRLERERAWTRPARAECAGGSRARGGGLRIYCPWTVLSWCTSARGRPGETCAAGLSLPNSGPVGPGAKCKEACGAQERRRWQGEGGIVCTHR